MSALVNKHCRLGKTDKGPLGQAMISNLMEQLDGWELSDQSITRTYRFNDYYQTISFVNAIAWIAHTEDHHPQLTVSYNSCKVEYSTHAANGLTENDFICASKVDAVFGSTT
ncbi:MAG: 4a-hydroxytetrahydrobiopterin dehydratase [Gallionella sp.]